MKENNIQKAVRQRDEIMKLLEESFLLYNEDEDNSWRCVHNFIQLSLQFEVPLLDWLLKI